MNRIGIRLAGRLVAILILCIAGSSGSVRAQTWQSLFGSAAGTETGRGGVKPLLGGGGYISVGSTNGVAGNSDVYVVQTDLNGGVIWAFAYDIPGQADIGNDIQECAGGGFIITGRSQVAGNSDLLLLRINAAGGIVWCKTFGGANFEVGLDVIEAANGDFVVAGTANPATQDGLIVRTTAVGVPVFVNTYASGGGGMNDELHGVWEAANGTLIVCGTTNGFGMGNQGWLMRTTGLTGVVLWAKHVGGGGGEEFNSVIELTEGAQAGDIVAVGSTTMPAPLDIYMARFNPVGALIAPDITFGTAAGVEEAQSVRESHTVANAGSMLLTGRINPGPMGMDDGYAIYAMPIWACPGPSTRIWSMAYGGAGVDQLFSGEEAPFNCFEGFVLCGHTASPGLLPAGDPQQMYVIRTDIFGVAGCNSDHVCDRCTLPGYAAANAAIVSTAQVWGVMQMPVLANLTTTQNLCIRICPPVPGPRAEKRDRDAVDEAKDVAPVISVPWIRVDAAPRGANGNAGNGVAGVPDASTADGSPASPNPVTPGGTFRIGYAVATSTHVSVTVSDIRGRIVYEGTAEVGSGSGALEITTAGWPRGSYLVRTNIGGNVQTQRVVVTAE